MIGQKLSPILEEIELTILEHDANVETKPGYTGAGFRAGIKIFMSVMMDKLWEQQDKQKTEIHHRANEAFDMGMELRDIILKYTGVDTHKLY